jgi:hypothetical protein
MNMYDCDCIHVSVERGAEFSVSRVAGTKKCLTNLEGGIKEAFK